ncbi:hypothetical protein [uncultured Sphingomonas sp.]|uniref:hypothetical protein n=1 Tax=uncultured Sphingomonas sp. TaxID=158754 RepID=UPI0035C9C0DC
MLLLAMFALQFGPPVAPIPTSPKLSAKRECRADRTGDEVVVCGRSNDEFRLKPLPDRYEPRPSRAEFDLGGAKLTPEVEQGSVGGIPTNRIMLRLKIPL